MMETLTVMNKEKTINAGDIIEVSMDIDLQVPEEDWNNNDIIDPSKYETKYTVTYRHPNGSGWTDVNYTDEAGCCTYFDINEYLEDCIKTDIDYLEDYEIFDVDADDGEHQSAKIRIKTLKED